ncbi:hypothetical protein HDU88_007051 [Geranomyces variabilis]|nr:hypothetical protein HDU88_007051 [Geranomyces variabilis]
MSAAARSQADAAYSTLSPAASAPPTVAAASPASSPLPPTTTTTTESSSRTPPPSERISPKLSSSPHRGRPPSALNRPRHAVDAQHHHHHHRPSSRDVSPVRTEFGDDQPKDQDDAAEDANNDTTSMRSAATSRTLRAAARPRPITKSQKISSMQNIFTESQKIAYVGLCYLSIVQKQKSDLKGLKKANESYAKWAEAFMEKLYIFLDIKTEERVMIKSLADHGLVPSDLSKSLIDDALKAARVVTERQEARQRAEEEALEKGLPPDLVDATYGDDDSTAEGGTGDPTDIRYTILSHLFILCIMEGRYDARSRTVLKNVARYLEVPWADVVQLEEAIATQLRIYEDSEAVSGNVEIVGKRNEADTKRRWIFTGLATLAGGAVIGLTAGLAAPLIAGGIGVALGTFGVTGASAALSTTGALALITTGGVLTGGGMGGVKMMKRTKGITQFEFLTLADGMKQIELNKEKRRTERRKKRRREAREALQEKMDHQRAADKKSGGKVTATTTAKADESMEKEDDKNTDQTMQQKLASAQQQAEDYLPAYEAPTDEKLDRIGNWVNITDSQRVRLDAMGEGGAALTRKGSKSAAPPVPNRPTAQELAEVTENRLSVSAGRLPPPAATAARRPSDAGRTDDNPNGAVWGLEEGFSWPDHENAPAEAHRSLEDGFDAQVSSTVLWESLPQLASESGSAPLAARTSREALRSMESNLDDTGTIDEEMAAAMFDDLQSTVDGDHAAYGDDDDDIRFKEPEGPPKAKQTNVLITVAGWITYGPDDHTLPFSTLEPDSAGDQYALLWETDTLQELGSALKLLVGEVASFLVQQGLQATVLSALMIGLAGPLWVMKLSYLVDNPWGIGLSKANKAGKVLADTLIQGVQENRPVTLIGYSLGARVIFHCLLELASRNAHGLIEEVYLLGCPVMAEKKEWEQISSVVAGRVVNGYATNDMVLGVLYRASVAVWNNVAGLRPVEGVSGVENIALDDVIQGHLDYRLCMPKVLEKLGFKVTRDYFDDEDEEEERERLELEEEQKKEKEERLRAKEARLQKKQEEYEEKLRRKKEEQERKRVEKEERDRVKEEARRKREEEKKAAAAAATPPGAGAEATTSASSAGSGSGRMSWFSRRSSARPGSSSNTSSTAALNKKSSDVVDDLMNDYWQPKEIASTLPPLVIAAADNGNSDDFTPKELKATLPPLVIRTQELRDEEGYATGSAGTTPAMTTATAVAGVVADEDLELARAQAEVEAAQNEVVQARAAAARAARVLERHQHEHDAASAALHSASAAFAAPDNSTAAVLSTSPISTADLERAMMMAAGPGLTSAGAGDLLDGPQARAGASDDDDNDDDQDDDVPNGTSSTTPPLPLIDDGGVAAVWDAHHVAVAPLRMMSPGVASLTAASDATSNSSPGGATFVDAEENPW